jgi:hypothetical protein
MKSNLIFSQKSYEAYFQRIKNYTINELIK